MNFIKPSFAANLSKFWKTFNHMTNSVQEQHKLAISKVRTEVGQERIECFALEIHFIQGQSEKKTILHIARIGTRI